MMNPEMLGLTWEDVNEAKSAFAQMSLCAGGELALLMVLHEKLGDQAAFYRRDAKILPLQFPYEAEAVQAIVDGLGRAFDEYRELRSITKEELEGSRVRILEWFDKTFRGRMEGLENP